MKTFNIEDIERVAKNDGSFDAMETNYQWSGTRSMRWSAKDERVRLSGVFKPDELRAVADWMEKHWQTPQQPVTPSRVLPGGGA